jgi:hypothetical protein
MQVIRTRTAPQHWSRPWLGLWVAVVVILFVGVFFLPWGAFAILFAIGFGVPEFSGLRREGDPYPPLTHVIRHFVAGWLAFPLLYGTLGLWGGKALGFPRWWAIGVFARAWGGSPTISCSRTSTQTSSRVTRT